MTVLQTATGSTAFPVTTLPLGNATGATVKAGGSYSGTPTVTVHGGAGLGATATATLSGTAVNSVSVSGGDAEYSNIQVSVDGTSGSGASVVGTSNNAAVQHVQFHGVSTYQYEGDRLVTRDSQGNIIGALPSLNVSTPTPSQ